MMLQCVLLKVFMVVWVSGAVGLMVYYLLNNYRYRRLLLNVACPAEDAAKAPGGGPPRITDSLSALLRHGLDHLHLEHVDTGDLLLLGLLFFLFREQADEELLVALGLLLIL